MDLIKMYIQDRELLQDKDKARKIKNKSSTYNVIDGVL